MKKRPQWMSKFAAPHMEQQDVLLDAARVIELKAAGYRREKNKAAARTCRYLALCLREAAKGNVTWEDAFGMEPPL